MVGEADRWSGAKTAGNNAAIPIPEFNALPIALQRRVLRRWVSHFRWARLGAKPHSDRGFAQVGFPVRKRCGPSPSLPTRGAQRVRSSGLC